MFSQKDWAKYNNKEVKKEIYSKTYTAYYPPIYLQLIFEILSLKNWVYEFDFFPSLNLIFAGYTGSKNQFPQTWNYKLENAKNHMQINSRYVCIS